MLELNNNLLVEIGGWPALKEARALVERGKVLEVSRDGAAICARVQGAEKVYDAQLTLADRVANVEVRCTCVESRRSGRVCAHVLAAGLAVLQPTSAKSGVSDRSVAAAVLSGGAVGSRRPPGDGITEPAQGLRRLPTETARPVAGAGPAPEQLHLKRWLAEEAPAGTPLIEITVLLPLQLRESLARDPVRIILEAQRSGEGQPQPWDALAGNLASGFAVREEDERLLAALERIAGSVSGINAVPVGKVGALFRALSGHPRVWLGKKERVEIEASAERPQIILSRDTAGALVAAVYDRRTQSTASSDGGHRPPLQADLPIAGWSFGGGRIVGTPVLPAGFVFGTRVIPHAAIPDFLATEFPALERNCELVFAPGFEEFQLETRPAHFEVRIDGSLAGLTLELVAHYWDEFFAVGGTTSESSAARTEPGPPPSPGGRRLSEYRPDSRWPNKFWRRDGAAEKKALAEIEAAGFKPARSGSTTFSLTHENHVAPFLANTVSRWRRIWIVTFGSRLEQTMLEIDLAQPEFSLQSGSGEDWLSLDLKLTVRGRAVLLPPAELHRWLQTGQTHARTADSRYLMLPTEAWGEMREILTDCEVAQEPGRLRVSRRSAPFLAEALTAQGFRPLENEAEGIVAPAPAGEVTSRLDPKLWAQLRPYQQHGVAWLAGLAQKEFHGLLADDMGLGKTLQALAFAAWLKVAAAVPSGGPSPGGRRLPDAPPLGTAAATTEAAILVVCPTSLVTNWLREAARFTPHLKTLDLTGPDRAEKFATRQNYDLLVTSYAILRRDVEQYRGDVFSLVILDEAQHIKNRSSQNAQSAKALRAKHRLILTGTPLENSVLDLWSLYDFLLPGYLGTAVEFKERYETPLTRGVSPRVMERLRHKVRPFFLRRTKEEVLKELPPKLEHIALCDLTDEQREVYRAVLEQGRREVFEHSGKAGKGRDRIAVLTTLLRLRQICCHLDMLPRGERPLRAADDREVVPPTEPAQGLRRLPDEEGTAAGDSGGYPRLGSRWKEPSAKLDRTFELIDEAVDGGHRVLVFSQFVRALHLLRDEARRRELKFCYLDGQTMERQAEVDRFQDDAGIPIFFISLKAGGVGLNLTGADTVIHFDPWWNPAVEEQATSRAHRMGQSRSVQAYKLIAAGTVEEKIQALQARKRELFEASFSDEAFVEKLTGDELEELLAE